MLTRLTTLLTFLLLATLAVACSDAEDETEIDPTPESVTGSVLDPVPTAGVPSGFIGHAEFRFDKPPSTLR